MNLGKSALSDAELIAILLGSGTRNESAVDLAKNILRNINDNLIELSKLDIKRLCRYKYIVRYAVSGLPQYSDAHFVP